MSRLRKKCCRTSPGTYPKTHYDRGAGGQGVIGCNGLLFFGEGVAKQELATAEALSALGESGVNERAMQGAA